MKKRVFLKPTTFSAGPALPTEPRKQEQPLKLATRTISIAAALAVAKAGLDSDGFLSVPLEALDRADGATVGQRGRRCPLTRQALQTLAPVLYPRYTALGWRLR